MSSIKTEFIKTADRFFGQCINSLLPAKKMYPNKIDDIKSMLLIRPGGLGDAFLLIPAIQAIKRIFKNASISVLAENRNYKAFKFVNNVNVYRYDNIREFLRVLSSQYNVVIDTEQWHRFSAIVARFVGKLNVGFATNDRKKNFDVAVKYYHTRYEIDSFMDLVDELCRFLSIEHNLDYQIPFIDIEAIDNFDVVIFTGASNTLRKWQVEKYRQLIKKLNGFKIALIGGSADVEFNKKIAEGLRVENFTNKLSLKETAGIIKGSKILFSTDSGILHLGVGLGVKTVSIFGPGIEDKWAPRGEKHIVINKRLPCSPCTRFGYTPKCPYGGRCMKEITVEEVYDKIMKLWKLG
ncbi:MAG: glycosyltransferase family 9 protein [Nitrospiraceae bacterium]|nr:glycosyltransferase family 9 protein [Nitrospiraceae bacterium]